MTSMGATVALSPGPVLVVVALALAAGVGVAWLVWAATLPVPPRRKR